MSDFPILDNEDAKQIEGADAAVRQSLAYDLRGKKQISYAGIKWIVLKMSEREALSVEISEDRLDRYGDDKSEWTWYATVKARNQKTGLESVGVSEQPYLLSNGTKDPFGRTKALSKAERNAYRKQISELEIQAMLNAIDPNQIQKIDAPSQPVRPLNPGPSGPTAEQIATLKKRGVTVPATRFEAAKLIKKLKGDNND